MSAPFLLLAALAQASPSAAVWRQPTGKWNVDYAENMCTLARPYGTEQAPLFLGFKPSPMSDNLQLVLIGPGKGRPAYVKTQVVVNEAAPIAGLSLAYTSEKSPWRVTLVDLKRSALEPLGRSGRLSITLQTAGEYKLTVDRFDVALKGLDACERDLLKHWGMSEELQASIVAKPLPLKSLASYIKNDDYPNVAIRMGEQGASGVRFMVGVDGKPSDCRVVEPSGSKILDETTCSIMLDRTRFSPALDRAGKPLPSLYFTRVRWVLPSG